MNSNKPTIDQIKYIGRMFAQDAWGNDDAEKAMKWYCDRLKEQIDKNTRLEMENFRLSVNHRGFLSWLFK